MEIMAFIDLDDHHFQYLYSKAKFLCDQKQII